MQELIPHVSCITTTSEEFEEAIASTYSEVYHTQNGEFFKHMKLRGGRFIRLKVETPPKGYVPTAEVKEEINFLPAGKIPFDFFEQIKCFFKEVMRLKKADYEAHAWILWSPTEGYYISVPKQEVSKASVSFTYEEETLPKDSIIVVDIHSHNTMGAFYSGTDNNNDKNGVYYSGVIGKLDTPRPEVVMRFNMQETKRKATLDEVFDIPKKEINIPKEWLDQVEVKTFTNVVPGNFTGTHNRSLWDDSDGVYGTYGRKVGLGYTNPELAKLIEQQEEELSDQADNHFARAQEVSGSTFQKKGQQSGNGGYTKPQNSASSLAALSGSSDEDLEDPEGESKDNFEISHGEDYDFNAAQYGVPAADAKDCIDAFLGELAEKDELLLEVLRDAYELLTEEGQTKIQTSGF